VVSPRPTSFISGETSWLTEIWVKPISLAGNLDDDFVDRSSQVASERWRRNRFRVSGFGQFAVASLVERRSTVPSASMRSSTSIDALVEQFGQDDLLGEDVGPRLVGDAERIAKSFRDQTSKVRSPLRSSSALVATVVPILTVLICGRDARVARRPEGRGCPGWRHP
jgi:hypothetical protein